ncbi:MAG: hypothetical protein U9N76_01560 [Candidatus Marinimicrobia bacterium]|nr:hypothetical protein [Candidatus Neomarinimicrobiota bacterium]
MKKVIVVILLALMLFGGVLNAQVSNTAGTMKPGRWSIGIDPIIYTAPDFGLFLGAGYGIARGWDLEAKLGLGNGTYFGANIEKTLVSGKPTLSLSAGAHIQNDVGLDGTLNVSFPLRAVNLYTGLDADINFGQNDTTFPLWWFFGAEIGMRKNFSLLFEIDAGINNPAPSMLVIGLNFYI